jgi:AcrR family transcriptional regulator
MKQPKTRRGQHTREQLLSAAEQVFGSQGFAAASIADITRVAGVAQGTFYIYFPSKEAVFRELVLEMGHKTRQALSSVTAQAPDRLAAEHVGLRAFLEFVKTHPDLYRIVEEAQFVDPDSYKAYFYTFAEAYQKRLDQAVAKGDIACADTEVMAWALMGLAKGLGERFALWGDTRTLDQVAETVFGMISSGLKP